MYGFEAKKDNSMAISFNVLIFSKFIISNILYKARKHDAFKLFPTTVPKHTKEYLVKH
jgi:hypothetical protein